MNLNRQQSKFKRILVVMAALSVMVLVASCTNNNDDAQSSTGKTIVTSFYPIEFVASAIAGDDFNVVNITPVGAEAHDFELSPSGTQEVLDSDLVIVLGQGFQPAIEDTAQSRDANTIVLLEALENKEQTTPKVVPARLAHSEDPKSKDEKSNDGIDPHIWLDPIKMQSVVSIVLDAVVEQNPDGKANYEDRANQLSETLGELDKQYSQELSNCELDTFVTSHDAFSLLAKRYNLTQESIAGFSPDNEPTPARLTELADLVQSKGIEIIFTEELVSQRVADTLSSEVGVQTKILSPIESLTQEQADNSDDYLTLMGANLSVLSQGLKCSQA